MIMPCVDDMSLTQFVLLVLSQQPGPFLLISALHFQLEAFGQRGSVNSIIDHTTHNSSYHSIDSIDGMHKGTKEKTSQQGIGQHSSVHSVLSVRQT